MSQYRGTFSILIHKLQTILITSLFDVGLQLIFPLLKIAHLGYMEANMKALTSFVTKLTPEDILNGLPVRLN